MALTNGQVYERASSDEENIFTGIAIDVVWKARKPPWMDEAVPLPEPVPSPK